MKLREVVVFSLVFMFIFSITGNMSSAYMNKSKMSNFTINGTYEKNKYEVELSIKDYVDSDDSFIDTIVLFKKDVKVSINDMENKQEYKSLNGFAGEIPSRLYSYLSNAWFVDAIQKNSKIYLTSVPLDITNVSFNEMPSTTDDFLTWGIDWINAEMVWGGTEDATDVSTTGYTGYGVKIGIIDSGIDYDHEDLDDNFIGGYSTNTDSSELSDLDDIHNEYTKSHGTHIAGIIAAEDNGLGVIGVAPEASLYAIKIPMLYESEAAAVSGIDHVIEGIDKAIEVKLDILSISLGFEQDVMDASDCSVLDEAVNRAAEKGIVVVCAAGNHWLKEIFIAALDYDPSINYPAACLNSIAVGCLEADTEDPDAISPSSVSRWCHSDRGPELDFMAPGKDVCSTIVDNSYMYQTGTSMACPMVTGVCALLLDVNPLFSPYDIKEILIETIEDLGTTGHDNYNGYGLISAVDAVYEAMYKVPSDTDNDGLYDKEEMLLGTNRLDSDTDGDMLSDGSEVNTYGTNPLCADTDGDTMIDGWEIYYSFDPLNSADKLGDPDGDLLMNYEEHIVGSNPHVVDTDGDGLSDYVEYHVYYTDLLNIDTDLDGFTDYYELFPPSLYTPSDPNDYNSIPTVGGGGPGGGFFQ